MNICIRFSLIFASCFMVGILILCALLTTSLFIELDSLQFLLATIFSTPFVLLFFSSFLFLIGFILGEVVYFFSPWYRKMAQIEIIQKNKKQIFYVFILLIFFLAGLGYNIFIRHINYDKYTQNDCNNLSEAWYAPLSNSKAWCLYTVARNTKNPLICTTIVPSQKDHFDIRSECLDVIASDTKNSLACDLITSNEKRRNDCYRQIGACEKSTNKAYQDDCYNVLNYKNNHPGIYINVLK